MKKDGRDRVKKIICIIALFAALAAVCVALAIRLKNDRPKQDVPDITHSDETANSTDADMLHSETDSMPCPPDSTTAAIGTDRTETDILEPPDTTESTDPAPSTSPRPDETTESQPVTSDKSDETTGPPDLTSESPETYNEPGGTSESDSETDPPVPDHKTEEHTISVDFSKLAANEVPESANLSAYSYNNIKLATFNSETILAARDNGMPSYIIYKINSFGTVAEAVMKSYASVNDFKDVGNEFAVYVNGSPYFDTTDLSPVVSGMVGKAEHEWDLTAAARGMSECYVCIYFLNNSSFVDWIRFYTFEFSVTVFVSEEDAAPVEIVENRINTGAVPASVAARVAAGDSRIRLSGGAAGGNLTAETGTRSDRYAVINFKKRGSAAEFALDLSRPVPKSSAEPVVLAIREIHRENGEVLAYTVYVDGKAVYFRTYGQIASAPNVLYVLVPRSSISDLKNVSVKIVSEGTSVFSVSDITVYTRLFESVSAEGGDDRLGIYLHSAASIEKAKSHINDFKGYSYNLYRLGLLYKVDYMNSTADEAVSGINSLLGVAGAAGWDVQLMPTVYWGQPNMTDGQGGMMTDAKYHQIAFSSIDGKYYGTTPNRNSSVVWITSASSVLNSSFAAKIKNVFGRVAGIIGQSHANGSFDGRVAVVMEHGVCYKGPDSSTGVSYNELDCADVGPLMVALAKKDGVTLDPSDGLNRTEKLWMIKHHADYNQFLADAYNEALGSESILVSGGSVFYPVYQTADNVLTHGVQWTERAPSFGDALVSGWKSGVGTGMYSSSEDMWWDDARFYQYKAAYGRVGTVNFEVSYSQSHDLTGGRSLLRKAYELGFEYLTLFNDASSYGTAKIIRDLDGIGSEKASFTVNHYDVPVLDACFSRDAAVSDWENVYGVESAENVTLDTKNGVLRLENTGEPGSISFRVKAGGTFENGLKLHVESLAGGGTITVYAGGVSLGRTGTGSATNYVNKFVSADYDIRSESKGKSSFDVKIVLTGSATVRAVVASDTFGVASGQLNGVSLTRSEARTLTLVTEREALAGNMLQRYYVKAGGKDAVYRTAYDLILQGKYKTAYEFLSQCLSEALPARFTVDGEGYLGQLGIYAKAGGNWPIGVTVLSKGGMSASFSFFTGYSGTQSANSKITMTVSGLDKGTYRLSETSFNTYTLKKVSGGKIKAENGTAEFTVTVLYGSADSVAKHKTAAGRVVSTGGSTVTILSQDTNVSAYSPRAQFSFTKSCEFSRRAEGSDETLPEKPQAGDYVILTFGNDGRAVVKAEAVYGRATGEIVSYIPPDYSDPDTHNGLIVFGNGRTFELEYLSYTTSLTVDGATKYVRALTDDELAEILIGKTVSIEYCPEYYGNYFRVLKITA